MRSPYTKLYVHCVWATWDRQPLLTPAVEARLYAAITAKCHMLRCEVVAIGGDLDHVHLLARFIPRLSIAELVQEVKGASSHLMNHEIAPRREFRWQGSYGAFTVSPRSVQQVGRYIHNQIVHHAERRTFDEWERCYLEEETGEYN
ncbi:MAG TPA: IS200/IS605 family transposase [Abditibacteriaceae bacterium]|nr:IS200/IS605 family transposase [Abditibacteriaceae bacterium]